MQAYRDLLFPCDRTILPRTRERTKAMELDPSSAWDASLRAWSRMAIEDYDGATEDCGKAIELDPSSLTPLTIRAWTRHRGGDKDGARKDCATVVERRAKSEEGRVCSGLLHYVRGEYREAVLEWEKVTERILGWKGEIEPLLAKAREQARGK